MNWLVDTNVLIDHLRGVSKATTFLRHSRSAGTLWLSAITVAEVYAGRGTRQSKQAAKIRRLLNLFRIAYVDGSVARLGGEIARDCGTALPDALIAATAVQKGLGSRHAQHFAFREHSQPQSSGSVLKMHNPI